MAHVPTDLAPYAAFRDELVATAQKLAAPGKGLLASDEPPFTLVKRLAEINVDCTDENTRRYREMMYTTPNLGDHVSGVIMFEKMLFEKTSDGRSFVEVLQKSGVVPGVKVDKGLIPLVGSSGKEQATQGLDGLQERCKEYYAQGARFAKWRQVLCISGGPSHAAYSDCVTTLAKYAAICQSEGLVPIVEPEVMLDGDHDLEKCQQVSEKVWTMQYQALRDWGILLEGTLLKPSMIVPGADRPKASVDEVAKATVDTLLRTVPESVPGIMFLSGGQSEEEATVHLQAMNAYKKLPWSLTFSFGRALQATPRKIWNGKDENVAQAQEVLHAFTKVNGMAALGQYDATKGHPSTTGSLYVKGYTY